MASWQILFSDLIIYLCLISGWQYFPRDFYWKKAGRALDCWISLCSKAILDDRFSCYETSIRHFIFIFAIVVILAFSCWWLYLHIFDLLSECFRFLVLGSPDFVGHNDGGFFLLREIVLGWEREVDRDCEMVAGIRPVRGIKMIINTLLPFLVLSLFLFLRPKDAGGAVSCYLLLLDKMVICHQFWKCSTVGCATWAFRASWTLPLLSSQQCGFWPKNLLASSPPCSLSKPFHSRPFPATCWSDVSPVLTVVRFTWSRQSQ